MQKRLSQSSLIAISGKQYSGKDFLAALILERLPEFRKIPIAYAIKQAYAEQHGLSLEEIEASKAEHRPGLIAMGDWGRKIDPNYWLKQVLSLPGRKIISDVRLKHEYDVLKDAGAFLLRLNADREIRGQRGRLVDEADPTETQLDGVTAWDAVLTNNGTAEDLIRKLEAIL